VDKLRRSGALILRPPTLHVLNCVYCGITLEAILVAVSYLVQYKTCFPAFNRLLKVTQT
jgi:hypothetical protein